MCNSMPEKGCSKAQLKAAVGCRITVGYTDHRALTGIYLGKRCFLTVSRVKGNFKIRCFGRRKQVISIGASDGFGARRVSGQEVADLAFGKASDVNR